MTKRTEAVRLRSTACVSLRKRIMATWHAHCKLSMTTLVKVASIKKRKKACYHTKENSYLTTLACHFAGSHNLSLNFVWELLPCVAMVKSLLLPIFTIDSPEWVKLKTKDAAIGWLFLIYYSLRSNSTFKPFKQLEVAKSTIYKVLQNLENKGATEKQLASGRPAVKPTKGKRKHLVNMAMDNDRVSLTTNAKKLGVRQISVQRVFREGLKY